jgi:phage terminase small subunit
MPARKPAGLRNRAETKAAKEARIANEAALEPERGLSVQAPARLKGHLVAQAAWRRLMRMYGELQATVVTRMDQDLLVDYCMLVEQLQEMDDLRKSSVDIWQMFDNQRKTLAEAGEIAEAVLMAAKEADTFEMIVKLDSRADRKRSLLLQLRQSLYLTPRARAAAVPAKKEKPEEPDELDELLNNSEELRKDVTDYVNGKRDGK